MQPDVRSVLAALVVLAGSPALAEFTLLGVLPGDEESLVGDMSADGQVIVGNSAIFDPVVRNRVLAQQPFAWTPESGLTGLGMPPGSFDIASAFSVSADGGSFFVAANSRIWRLAAGGSYELWPSSPGAVTALGVGGSADGDLAVGAELVLTGGQGAFQATLWPGPIASPVQLGYLPGGGAFSAAFGINADGSVIVGYSDSSQAAREAFVWTPLDGMLGVGFLPGGGESALSRVTPDGSLAVGFSDSAQWPREAVLWNAGTGLVGLGVHPAHVASAGITLSADGGVIGGCGYLDFSTATPACAEALLWTGAGPERLVDRLQAAGVAVPPGWTPVSIIKVSDDGQWIAGIAVSSAGHRQGYRARIQLAPVAGDDEATVGQGAQVSIDVLGNDTGFADPVTVGLFLAPQNGQALVQGSPGPAADVRILYTPNAGFTGTDSFVYVVDDGTNLGFATVTVEVIMPVPDTDGDGIADDMDNCLGVFNPDQRDTDGDGFGNRCDADFNNDGVVNFADLAIFRSRFGTTNPDADLNGDGVVNFADLAIFNTLFGKPPGPSAVLP